MMILGSLPLYLGFCLITAFLCAFWLGALSWAWREREAEDRRNALTGAVIVMIAWLGITGGLAASGALADFTFPPRIMPVFTVAAIAVGVMSLLGIGRDLASLPLGVLVGFQAFRIVVEILLHQAYSEGLIGAQMTWSGLNFDIVTGVSALLIAPFAVKLPKGALIAWNVMGLGLLVTIVTISILSMPTPFRAFIEGPANTFVAEIPYVWLPTVIVMSALMGHLLLFRRLLFGDNQEEATQSR